MYKKVTIVLASTAFLLSACGGINPAYQKGETLYEKGDYNSLVKSKQYFDDYASKNPNDNGVSQYLTKVNAALISMAKDKTTTAYNNRDILKAMEYVKVAKQCAPNDSSVSKAYDLVKKAYDNQIIYNNFSNYLEDRYIETKDISDEWDAAVKSVETGQQQLPYLKTVVKSLYLKITTLRDTVNSESFNLTGDDQAAFLDANTTLFNYIVEMEDELSRIMDDTNNQTIDELKDSATALDPGQFNSNFVTIQNKMSDYVNEKDNSQKEVRHISDTLNFTKAYEEKKASEEAAKNPQSQTTTAPTSSKK